MSKDLYVSRDIGGSRVFTIWTKKPQWNALHKYYMYSDKREEMVFDLDSSLFDQFFPQLKLEHGQLAKIERDMVEVYTGFPKVAVFTLGEIVEDHGEK